MRIICRGAVQATVGEVSRISSGDRVLLVTGARSGTHPSLAPVFSELNGKFDCRRYTVKEWLATIEEYDAYKSVFSGYEPGCIVAVGGGRIIDFAKIIATNLSANDVRSRQKNGEPIIRTVPLVAVPTTAGSGAEATPFAVFYFGGKKSSITHPSLLPDSEIVDANLLDSLSTRQLAISGADAVCQAIESVFSPVATPETLLLSRGAFTIGIPALKAAVAGERAEFGESLALASNLAGQAITRVRTNVPHALSYFLTSHYNVPHGQAVSFHIGAYLEDALTKVRALPSPPVALAETCAALELSLGATGGIGIVEAWSAFLLDIGLEPHFIHKEAATIRDGILASADTARLKNLIVPLDIAGIVEQSIQAEPQM
jgi:alcohol dehydrogenase class IV